MSRTRRTGVLAAAASFALVAGGMLAGLPAAAEGTTFIDGGKLTLATSLTAGPANSVSYTGTEFTGGPQELSTTTLAPTGASNCDLASPAAGPLMAFKGYLGDPAAPTATPNVGFKSGSIGVNEEIDALCARVDTISKTGKTEYLDIGLSDKLVNYAGRRLLATSASLDIEVKQTGFLNSTKAKIEATALRAGVPVPQGTFTLVQGAAPATPAPNTFYCNVSDQKNCQWIITPPTGTYFDAIRLKAVAAGFSLEGGSDVATDANAKPTTFDLVSEVDKLLTCDDPTLIDGSTTVQYVGNADPGAPCGTGFGAVLTTGDAEVRLLKPRNVDPSAQFVFDIDWKVAGDGTPSPTIPDTVIDFEIAPNVQETPLQFCSTYPDTILARNAAGDLGIADFAAFNASPAFPDFDSDSPEKEFACIDTRSNLSVTVSDITYTDTVFAIGDLKMTPR